jgi:hypothetical protein
MTLGPVLPADPSARIDKGPVVWRNDDYDYRAADHPVGPELTNATLLDYEDRGTVKVVLGADSTWPTTGIWLNEHRIRFVAGSDPVALTLTDKDAPAGGRYNIDFVQVQPFFAPTF